MNKWKKISMTTALVGLGTISMAITPIVLVSCSDNSNSLASSLISLNNQYLNKESTLLADNAGMMPKFEGDTPDFSQLIKNSSFRPSFTCKLYYAIWYWLCYPRW